MKSKAPGCRIILINFGYSFFVNILATTLSMRMLPRCELDTENEHTKLLIHYMKGGWVQQRDVLSTYIPITI